MKKLTTIKYFFGALLFGAAVTACDKFEDDVPPARMGALILNDDHYSTLKNHGLQLHVLANDTIGSTATVQFGLPQAGTIHTDSLGNVYYQPGQNFVGTDAFTYKACLGNDCATANVTVSVLQDTTNVCTVRAFDDVTSIPQGKYDSVAVLLNDNLCGELPANTVITINKQPAHGYGFVLPNKYIWISADTNRYNGTDELTYTITNSKGTSTAKVRFNIPPAPQPCHVIARPDSAYTNRIQGSTMDSVTIKVLANDIICVPNVPVNFQLLTQGTNYGTISSVNYGGTTRVIYVTRPNAPAVFNDAFQYRICERNNCSTTWVYIHRR